MSIQLNFYDEQLDMETPKTHADFKSLIAAKFLLDPEDVNELIVYFLDRSNDKVSLSDEGDFSHAVEYLNKESNLNKKFVLKIFLEVSEKSKLFKREFETSKICTSMPMVEDGEAKMREQLKNEILEKERQLKVIMEKEKEQREKMEREVAEKAKMEKIKFEKEQFEREAEQREKDKIKESITKVITESVNKNLDKLKEDMISKAVKEAIDSFETNKKLKDSFIKKDPVFIEDILPKVERNEKKEFEYKRLIRELRETYALNGISDESLLEALRKSDGKVEEALASLFK